MNLVYLACLSSIFLALVWWRHLGSRRTLAALTCRLLWLAPLLLAFFPQPTAEELPRTLASTPLHVLVDDSESMKAHAASRERYLEELRRECHRLGCSVKESRLSELDQATAAGYTPLSRSLESWFGKVGDDPWLILSDGGDFEPSLPWSEKLRDQGKAGSSRGGPHRGSIINFASARLDNLWVSEVDLPPFSFDDKVLTGLVNIGRQSQTKREQHVQIQASLDGKTLATANTSFAPGATTATAELSLPPLPRGRHLVVVKALPPADEQMTWDNEAQVQVEVMPNTVGVLHLLGSPSWDGRFFRRFLKAEPKYDLISFYILRDPWDSQAVSERELSLIPFPVSRLFNEELPNFRVVVLQNFTLLQFLQPEYQQNLVKFVKDGGGLLFLGGDRALLDSDLRNSPLREILPFSVAGPTTDSLPADDLSSDDTWAEASSGSSKNGPWYEPDLAFRISMANPTADERSLANVYDDWRSMQALLAEFPHARGLHHMEQVSFKKGAYTPLLQADRSDGKKTPLAIASYPGKGRALWIFSDSFWRMAQIPAEKTSRELYPRFMQAAMTWLLRQDLRKPLIARGLVVRQDGAAQVSWQASLQGPAVPYFKSGGQWQLQVCGQPVSLHEVTQTPQGNQSLLLSGSQATPLNVGERCSLEIRGEHPAFGSVQAAVAAMLPQRYLDKDVGNSPQKLEQLANLTAAQHWLADERQTDRKLQDWLASLSDSNGLALPTQQVLVNNHYWHLDHYWLWLLLLFMPLEVIIRRWPEIVWGKR